MRDFSMCRSLAVLLAFCVPVSTHAASVKFTPLEINGLVVGNKYSVDDEFAKAHGVAVPVGYSFIAPRKDAQKIYVKEAPGGDASIKLFFTTQEDQVQSHIQFVPFTVDMVPMEERLKGLQGLVKQAFLSSVQNNSDAKVNVMQFTKVGKYQALEMVGNYPDPADGVIVRRIVAIPHPESRNGVAVIINAITKNTTMTRAEDIMATSASEALSTFKFLDP